LASNQKEKVILPSDYLFCIKGNYNYEKFYTLYGKIFETTSDTLVKGKRPVFLDSVSVTLFSIRANAEIKKYYSDPFNDENKKEAIKIEEEAIEKLKKKNTSDEEMKQYLENIENWKKN